MLDLLAVARQLHEARSGLAALGADRRDRLSQALGAWEAAAAAGAGLRDRLRAARTSWLVAEPLEELRAHPVGEAAPYRVVAVDGSQIFPDRHELRHCFVVNVGLVDIDYAHGCARLSSTPSVAWSPEDLYPLVGGIRQEADTRVVGARRFAAECLALAQALEGPALALMDGTLLLWWLEADPERLRALGPEDVKAQALAGFRRLLEAARGAGATVAGYLSAPRATDVVAMLKVVLCTEDPVDCDRCPYFCGAKSWTPAGASSVLPVPDRPCEEAAGLTDADLFDALLAPGQRSPRFRSAAQVAAAYPCPVDFFYLHTGTEVARVEVPAWTEPAELEEAAARLVDQCRKGLGYPVALAEAHEQAVVRAADRRAFLELWRRGGGELRASPKLVRKRRGVL